MNAQIELQYRKKDFWRIEGQKYATPHFRLEKSARIINSIAGARSCDLLDVGCGPGTLETLLTPNIRYHGIDISIAAPSDKMRELDILSQSIEFDGRRFDLVVAQGLFEYLGDHQEQKFREIAEVLAKGGTFLTSYVNFEHRRPLIYEVYNNVQSHHHFRRSLSGYFTIERVFPTSHNWGHTEPRRRMVKGANMNLDLNVPYLSRKLGVEYFFICRPLEAEDVSSAAHHRSTT